MTTVNSESLPAVAPARRIDMDGRRCVVTPDRVAIRPSRSLVLLPAAGLALGLLLVAAAVFWRSAIPSPLAILLVVMGAVVLGISGVGIIFLALGAEVVVERRSQSAVWRRGLLGLGGRETVSFPNVARLEVEETVPRHKRGAAQFEVALLDTGGRRVRMGAVTVPRSDAAEGLDRARSVAEAMAGVAGKPAHVGKARHRRPRVVRQQHPPPEP